MSDTDVDEEMVKNLMNLTAVGLGVSAVFAISQVMISSARALADTFATSVQHHHQLSSVELATTAKCVSNILGTRKTTEKAPEKTDMQMIQNMIKAESHKLACY